MRMLGKFNAYKSGFSLTEFAIVLGVIGTVTGGIWYSASYAVESVRREQAFEDIQTIVQKTRDFYVAQASLPSLGYTALVPVLIQNNIIPSEIVRRPASAANCTNSNALCADTPWGMTASAGGGVDQNGTLRLCDWDYGSSNACTAGGAGASTQYFAVVLRGLPIGSCIALAGKVSSSLGPTGLVEVNINGCNVIENVSCGAYTTTPSLPVAAADAVNLCNLTNKDNILRFVYRLRLPQQ